MNKTTNDGVWTVPIPAISLRDYLAAAALTGIWSCPGCDGSHAELAERAYKSADAMLAEREKT